MAADSALQVHPGLGLGFLNLGASLYDVLNALKAQPFYSTLNLSYSPSAPLVAPIILDLPPNGLRLRFDGPDQRLRLIEVLDFTKTSLRYKNIELVKLPEGINSKETPWQPTGPAFRHVYNKLMGPSFPGEYKPPSSGSGQHEGLYVLSYPGIAFTFYLHDSAWSADGDFVEMLSSNAASAALSMAIFDGRSWPEARQDLMYRSCPYPRSLSLSAPGKDSQPDEVEMAIIRSQSRIDLERRSSPTFEIELSKTTPQDLVAELGPPNAVYRKSDRRLSIHKTKRNNEDAERRFSSTSHDTREEITDTDQSSGYTHTDNSDNETQGNAPDNEESDLSEECFYNYFDHGFDVFISYPAAPSRSILSFNRENTIESRHSTNNLVATKVLFHGNVPGSFPFNRYRRSRWAIQFDDDVSGQALNSETPFSELAHPLMEKWQRVSGSPVKDLHQNAMVLNRDWNDSPGSSCEFLGDWEEDSDSSRRGEPNDKPDPGASFGNTKLYGFPGLLFEVLKNDAVSCLTVY